MQAQTGDLGLKSRRRWRLRRPSSCWRLCRTAALGSTGFSGRLFDLLFGALLGGARHWPHRDFVQAATKPDFAKVALATK
jgi:hypothetical protein